MYTKHCPKYLHMNIKHFNVRIALKPYFQSQELKLDIALDIGTDRQSSQCQCTSLQDPAHDCTQEYWSVHECGVYIRVLECTWVWSVHGCGVYMSAQFTIYAVLCWVYRGVHDRTEECHSTPGCWRGSDPRDTRWRGHRGRNDDPRKDPVKMLTLWVSDYPDVASQLLDNDGLDEILHVRPAPGGTAIYCPVCNGTI